MRLILFLLLLSFQSFGQGRIVVNGWQQGPPPCNLLLDSYSGASAAYSLRKLDCDYSGSAIRVRRSSDDAEQDIGFDGNDLDETALLAFVGTGGTDDGFVVTWYDQSGNSNDVTNATAANQPKIVEDGSVITVGGFPAVLFDGSNDFLKKSIAFTCTDFSVFAACSLSTVSGVHMIVDADNGGGTRIAQFIRTNDAAAESIGFNGGSPVSESNSTTLTASAYLFSVMKTSSTIETFVNNASSGGTSFAANNNTGTTDLTIGAFAGGAGGFNYSGAIREVILYETDNSANRTAISNNINSYYSIY